MRRRISLVPLLVLAGCTAAAPPAVAPGPVPAGAAAEIAPPSVAPPARAVAARVSPTPNGIRPSPGEGLPRPGEVVGEDHPVWAHLAPAYRPGMSWTYLITPIFPDEPARERTKTFILAGTEGGVLRFDDDGETIFDPVRVDGPFLLYTMSRTLQYLGTEDVTVPAGTFAAAAKFRIWHEDFGPNPSREALLREKPETDYLWFVAGIGQVKRRNMIEVGNGAYAPRLDELVAFHDGGAVHLPTRSPSPSPQADGAPIALDPGPLPDGPACGPAGGGVVSTVAGASLAGFGDGPSLEARFGGPRDVAVDRRTGVVYVADEVGGRIRAVLPGGEVRTLAGDGVLAEGSAGAMDGPGLAARFTCPRGLAVDGAGNVYVADTFAHRIRRIDPAGVVTTFAGSGASGAVDGVGGEARFDGPQDVAIDAQGNLYTTECGGARIRRISPEGKVTTIAVGERDGGPSTWSCPEGIAVAADGTVYFTEGEALWRMAVGGTPERLSSEFQAPTGLAVDAAGMVYVSDTPQYHVKRVDPRTGNTTLVTGARDEDAEIWQGFVDGAPLDARFGGPAGLAFDGCGRLYIADAGNKLIRMLTF